MSSVSVGILSGLLMGIVFGFALEKSRVFEPGVIVGQMQLRNFLMLKVFLTASAACRAERRYKQLISKGIPATLDSLRADLEARDARDSSRTVAPLKPAQDARLMDNSDLTVQSSVQTVLDWWQSKQPF
mgnify:CR=1 FL=1